MAQVYLVFRAAHGYDYRGDDEYSHEFVSAHDTFEGAHDVVIRAAGLLADKEHETLTETLEPWSTTTTFTYAAGSRGIREFALIRQERIEKEED